jgi:FkbM family methyltransferase
MGRAGDTIRTYTFSMGVARVAKNVAKKWVRPIVIPPVRFIVRYAPSKTRRFAWRYVVEPFLEYAEHDFIATTRFGTILAGNTLDLIQRYVFYFGEWEPNLSRYVADRLRPGDVFVDVGANIGYFSLLASTIVGPMGKVVALEASPTIHGLLLDNIRRNRVSNVLAINVAAADRPGLAHVFLWPGTNIGKTSIVATSHGRYECDVPAQPLDALLMPELIEKVRFVKIDVEGAEWLVIRGMREALHHARPDLEIVVELSPRTLRAQGTTAEEVLAVFAAARFHPYRLENDYSAGSYMDVADVRPRRITGPISAQTDVVFSRRDAAFL